MRRTIKVNNEVLKRMKIIFYPKGSLYYDWMGFKITDENKPSYHHIIKAEDLRKKKEDDIATIENGAYLGKKSHELLHKIEVIDKDLYDSWNSLFMVINKKREPISDELWDEIYRLKTKTLKCLEKDNKVLKIML